MSVAWIAGAVRGRALARRCLGAAALERVSAQDSLRPALRLLADSTYGHALNEDMDPTEAERAVSETVLWHLRVLAGWLPAQGVGLIRAIAAWFELANIEELAVALASGTVRPPPPHRLGALAIVWSRASSAHSLQELRSLLAHSDWGDPGGDTLPDILLGLHLGWARMLRRAVGERPEWGEGALALATAKALFLQTNAPGVPEPNAPGAPDRKRVPELGRGWEAVRTVGAFTKRLPPTARWVLRDVQDPGGLWRAELLWWLRLESDATALLEEWKLGRPAVVGAAALLLADGWRTRAALSRAARGGGLREESDAAA